MTYQPVEDEIVAVVVDAAAAGTCVVAAEPIGYAAA